MKNYNKGFTYTKKRIDTAKELLPQNAAFRSFEGEMLSRQLPETVTQFNQVLSAAKRKAITELDKDIVCLLATFGTGAMASKSMREMLYMMGWEFSDNVFESSIKRLHRHNLIDLWRFKSDGRAESNLRIITLSALGSKFANALGWMHSFSNTPRSADEPHYLKSQAQTAQLISNYLKNGLAEQFRVRPIIKGAGNKEAIVRPAAVISISGQRFCFEVPRRHEGWKEELADKLRRYRIVFDLKGESAIVINCEDEDMSRETAAVVAELGAKLDVLYTHDLAMFGNGFRHSLYSFAPDGTKQCFELDLPYASCQ